MTSQQHDPGGRAKPKWPADSTVTADFSECGKYRYSLTEIWDPTKPSVMWVMMNPSVACLDFSDPTLIKTGKFARAWRRGSQIVCNVHAYRATDKKKLLTVDDPIGPLNDEVIKYYADRCDLVILAFGQPPKALRARNNAVVQLLQYHTGLSYLKLAKDGTPYHPLYLCDALTPRPYPTED